MFERLFTSKADDYDKGRPGYPKELLTILRKYGLSKQSTVADIGAGTGLFTRLIAPHAKKIIAVEPNADMLSKLNERRPKNASLVQAPAEATTIKIKTVDFITVAQAFHWFHMPSAKKEFAKILKDDGRVAIIYNNECVDTNQEKAFQKLRLAFKNNKLYRARFSSRKRVRSLVNPDAFYLRGEYETHNFINPVKYNQSAMVSRVASMSAMPKRGDKEFPKLQQMIGDMFRKVGKDGVITINVRTTMFVGKVK